MIRNTILLHFVAFIAAATLARHASAIPTAANWLQPTSGDWNDPTKWSIAPFFPNDETPSGAIYAATLGTTRTPYTIDVTSNTKVGSLHLTSPDVTLRLNNASLGVRDALTLTGQRISIESNTNRIVTFQLPSDYSISSGDIVFDGVSSAPKPRLNSLSGNLTIGPNATVRTRTHGGDIFSGSDSSFLINEGLISTQAPYQTLDIHQMVDNQGTIEAHESTAMFLHRSAANYDAEAMALTGGRWIVRNAFLSLSCGTINTLDADVTIYGRSMVSFMNGINLNKGKLALLEDSDFPRKFTTFTNAGSLTLGRGSTLSTKNLVQSPEASLSLQLAGTDFQTEFGSIRPSTSVTLAGRLTIELVDNYLPLPGDTFTLVSAPSVSGAFSAVDFPALPNGWIFNLSYSPTAVTAAVVPEPSAFLLLPAAGLALRRRRGPTPTR